MYRRIETRLEALKRKLEEKIQPGMTPEQYREKCRKERDAYLAELLRQGKAAETLAKFMDEFILHEQHTALSRLERECDPVTVQEDYLAALRLQEYLDEIIVLASQKRERGHQVEL